MIRLVLMCVLVCTMTILSPQNDSRDLLGRWFAAMSGERGVSKVASVDGPVAAALARQAVSTSVAAAQDMIDAKEPVRVAGLRSTIGIPPASRSR